MNARHLLLAVAPLAMAITMPSCPGQEAMQAQIDQHQTQVTSLVKRVGELENQVKALNGDMTQAKTFLPQMAQAIQAQKAQIDALEARLNAAGSKRPAAKGKK